MEKGYVSASPGIYWSRRKITFTRLFKGLRWEPLLKVSFAGWITSVNAEGYRCPNCKVVIFSYEEKRDAMRERAGKVEKVAG
jgi:hypothetical protein